jgi:pimeloyl-ACP methyl ester carboxylesterase
MTTKEFQADNLPPVPAVLQKWRSEGAVKEINGHQIFVHTSGPKSDHGVLIVHGYPGSSWDWQGVVDRIGDKARVVVSDMRGFGLSEKPLEGTYLQNYSLMLQADIYEAVAKAEGLSSVILVAHDMGQTVGLELMARQEEGRLPFRIRHAIIVNGSTLVDMIQLAEMQVELLQKPDQALTEDLDFGHFRSGLAPTFGKEFTASDGFDMTLDAMTYQVFHDKGSRVMAQILRYLKERQEDFGRWSRTFFTFQSAPMTLIWGQQDPVALEAMADRVKKERPYTDLYKYPDVAHWPSIEAPNRIGDAIIARLDSV